MKNDIELHHNCGGVCACSTCHLYVDQGEAFLEELSDREEDFIDRAVNPRLNSRLGCQCVLLDGVGFERERLLECAVARCDQAQPIALVLVVMGPPLQVADPKVPLAVKSCVQETHLVADPAPYVQV